MPLHEAVLHHLLERSAYIRVDRNAPAEAFRNLGVQPSHEVMEFYSRFQGPFGSPHTGFELLDPCGVGLEDSLCVATQLCRETFALPQHFLVISTYLGNGVLMLDTITDRVFNVDFEGGFEDLLMGTLPAEGSFVDFLAAYFTGSSRLKTPAA